MIGWQKRKQTHRNGCRDKCADTIAKMHWKTIYYIYIYILITSHNITLHSSLWSDLCSRVITVLLKNRVDTGGTGRP